MKVGARPVPKAGNRMDYLNVSLGDLFFLRKEVSRAETGGAKMGTDWFVKAKCPKPKRNVTTEEEHIELCSGCPNVIWEKPEGVAGFMSSMCGVRVGSVSMAAELDDVGEEISGVERFTKEDSKAQEKREILERLKTHVDENGWRIDGFSREETLEHLATLIEFCRRAESKGLDIRVWV